MTPSSLEPLLLEQHDRLVEVRNVLVDVARFLRAIQAAEEERMRRERYQAKAEQFIALMEAQIAAYQRGSVLSAWETLNEIKLLLSFLGRDIHGIRLESQACQGIETKRAFRSSVVQLREILVELEKTQEVQDKRALSSGLRALPPASYFEFSEQERQAYAEKQREASQHTEYWQKNVDQEWTNFMEGQFDLV